MGLLPEFFTLLGIEIFAALSLISALLDRDIPSPARWLFQGAAAAGLGQLVFTEGFSSSGVIDALRFWISIFYLTLSVCSVAGLNVYLVAVPRKMALASGFAGAITVPTVIVSALFVSSYLSGIDVSFTPLTILLLIVPALVVSLGAYEFTRKVSRRVIKTPNSLQPASLPATAETPKKFAPFDPKAILAEWEESQKKKDRVA